MTRVECTGGSASWCPNHGTCRCPRHEDGERIDGLAAATCPLHGDASLHARQCASCEGETGGESDPLCSDCLAKCSRAFEIVSAIVIAACNQDLTIERDDLRARLTEAEGKLRMQGVLESILDLMWPEWRADELGRDWYDQAAFKLLIERNGVKALRARLAEAERLQHACEVLVAAFGRDRLLDSDVDPEAGSRFLSALAAMRKAAK